MTSGALAARLDELLAPCPGGPELAGAIEASLLRLVAGTWSALVESCAVVLAPGSAEALRVAAASLPGTELLLPRLAAALSPATLLGLPMPDGARGRSAMAATLLAQPSPQHREQVLDALQAGTDTASLGGICTSWARRMLVATLGSIDALSQQDRLALQERLLALRRDASGPHAARLAPQDGEAGDPDGDLGEALSAASHRRASRILAARAGVPPAMVETAITRRDREGLLALCRAAGAGPEETMALQIQLARICPSQTLACTAPGSLAGTWRLEALRGRLDGLAD
ncbi:hypothetical protein [Lichenicoccus sp.]|uniref:hypothetical protein n=1 Tax=Lichenicoccus sp. TaxID=2781899 RepID=UPI003D136DC1